MRKQCSETITHTAVILSRSTTCHLLLVCWQSMTSAIFEGMVTQAACSYKACQGWLHDSHDYVVEYSRSWDNAWILSKILPTSWQGETVWRLWTILRIWVQEVSVQCVLVLKVCAHQLQVYLHALASLSWLGSMTAMFWWLAFIFAALIFFFYRKLLPNVTWVLFMPIAIVTAMSCLQSFASDEMILDGHSIIKVKMPMPSIFCVQWSLGFQKMKWWGRLCGTNSFALMYTSSDNVCCVHIKCTVFVLNQCFAKNALRAIFHPFYLEMSVDGETRYEFYWRRQSFWWCFGGFLYWTKVIV